MAQLPNQEAAPTEARTVGDFRELVRMVGTELDRFTLDRLRTLSNTERHELLDARAHLMEADRSLAAAEGKRRRRRHRAH